MKTNRRVLYALMLAAVSGLGACERTDGLGDVTGPEIQQQFSSNGNPIFTRSVEALRRSNPLTGDVTYSTVFPIGPMGGTLTFGGHKLVVPKNALKHWTHFRATLRAGDEIRIDMRAFNMFGPVTNFARPVELTIDFSDALNLIDALGVAVYYMNPAGTLERMPSVVNAGAHTVTGYLNHFSDYIPGTLRNESQGEL